MYTPDDYRRAWGAGYEHLTDIEVAQHVAQQAGMLEDEARYRLGVPFSDTEGGVVSSVKRGFGQTIQGMGDFVREEGPEFLQGLGTRMYRTGKEITQEQPAQISSLADVWESPWQTVKEGFGEGVGQMGPSVLAGMAGAKTGASIGMRVGAFFGGVPGAAAGTAVGGTLGALAGVAGMTYPQEFAQVREEQRAQGLDTPEDISRARTAAGLATIPEVLIGPEMKLGKLLTKTGAGITEAAARGIMQPGMLGRVGREFVRGGLQETVTEYPQTLIEKWGAYQDPLSAESQDEALLSGVKAFWGGGPFGAVSGVSEYRQAKHLVEGIDHARTILASPDVAPTARINAAQLLEGIAARDFGPDSAAVKYLVAKQDDLYQQLTADLNSGIEVDLTDIEQQDAETIAENIKARMQTIKEGAEVPLPLVAEEYFASVKQDRMALPRNIRTDLTALEGAPFTPEQNVELVTGRPVEPGVGTLTQPLGAQDAIQVRSPEEVLQREQAAPAKARRGRKRVEPVIQEQEVTQESQAQAIAEAGIELEDTTPETLKSALVKQPLRRMKGFAYPILTDIKKKDGEQKARQVLRGLMTLLERPRAEDNPTHRGVANVALATKEFGEDIVADFQLLATQLKEWDKAVSLSTASTIQNKPTAKTKSSIYTLEPETQRARIEPAMQDVQRFSTEIMGLINNIETKLGKGDQKRGHATLQAVQIASKTAAQSMQKATAEADMATTGQTPTATLFSQFYRLYNNQAITPERPMGVGVSEAPVREEGKLQGVIDKAGLESKLEEVAGGFLAHGKEVTDKNRPSPVVSLLNYFGERSNLPWQRRLSKQIKATFEKAGAVQPDIVWETTDTVNDDGKTPAHYDPSTHTIHIAKLGHNAENILHEMLHAALHSYIQEQGLLGVRKQSAAYRDLATLLPIVTKKLAKDAPEVVFEIEAGGAEYRQIQELIAYVMTNRKAQETLGKVELTKTQQAKFKLKDAWSLLLHLIRQIFGLGGESKTVLEQMVLATDVALAETTAKTPPTDTGEAPLNATIKVTGFEGKQHRITSNPDRESVIAAVKAAPDRHYIRGFYNENTGRVAFSFGAASDAVMHSDAAKSIGWKHKITEDGLEFYETEQGQKMKPVYFDTAGDTGELRMWYSDKDHKVIPEGAFIGETAGALASTVMTGKALAPPTTPGTKDSVYGKYGWGWSPLEGVFKTMLPGLYGKDKKVMEKLEAFAHDSYEKLAQVSPYWAGKISYINENANIADWLAKAVEIFKSQRHIPVSAANQFGTWIKAQRDDAEGHARILEAFAYLDDKTIQTKLHDHEKVVIDRARQQYENVLAESSDLVKQRLSGLKPSEALTLATSSDSVTSTTFGIQDKKLLARASEPVVASSSADPNNNNIHRGPNNQLSGKFYLYKDPVRNENSMWHESALDKAPSGVNKDIAYSLVGPAEKSRTKAAGKDPTQGQDQVDYLFQPITSVENLIKSSKGAEKAADAFLNTLSIMGNAVATRALAETVASQGKGTVMFDTKDELNKFVNARRKKLNPKAVDRDIDVHDWGQSDERGSAVSDVQRRPGNWIKLPKSEAYGALSDKYIESATWARIQDALNRKPLLNSDAYNGLMRIFRKTKTVYSPTTMATNIMSNVTIAAMHNVKFSTVSKAMNILRKYYFAPGTMTKAETQIMTEFLSSGATLGDWSTSEVRRSLYDAIAARAETEREDTGIIYQLKQWANYEKRHAKVAADIVGKYGKKADAALTELYSAGDNAFRLAGFMTKMSELEQGKAGGERNAMVLEAGSLAKDMFMNYDIDSRAAQLMRQGPVPFFSFTYAFSKVMFDIAKNKPWRLAEVALVYTLVSAALSASEDEEDRKERIRGKKEDTTWFGAYKQWKIAEKDGKSVYFNAARWFMPTPLDFKDQPNGFMGIQNWPAAITPSNPLLTSLIAGFGFDPYTGEKLGKDTDDGMDKAMKSLNAIYNQVVPPLAGVDREGRPKILPKPPGAFMKEADTATQYAGMLFPVSSVDKEASRRLTLWKIEQVKRAFDEEIKTVQRNAVRGMVPRKDVPEIVQSLRETMNERVNKLREGL